MPQTVCTASLVDDVGDDGGGGGGGGGGAGRGPGGCGGSSIVDVVVVVFFVVDLWCLGRVYGLLALSLDQHRTSIPA